MSVVPLGIWTALGGCWIFVLSGIIILLARKQYWLFAAFVASMCAVIGPALLVWDLTRSLAYVLPAVFIGLSLLAKNEDQETIERVCFIGATLSVIIPTYWIKDALIATWLYPLPIQLMRLLFHLPLRRIV
jgi:hypothetical protein